MRTFHCYVDPECVCQYSVVFINDLITGCSPGWWCSASGSRRGWLPAQTACHRERDSKFAPRAAIRLSWGSAIPRRCIPAFTANRRLLCGPSHSRVKSLLMQKASSSSRRSREESGAKKQAARRGSRWRKSPRRFQAVRARRPVMLDAEARSGFWRVSAVTERDGIRCARGFHAALRNGGTWRGKSPAGTRW